MKINIFIPENKLLLLNKFLHKISQEKMVILFSLILAITATTLALLNNVILAYGDAESHLNIAKKIISSLTPGFAQLGGIWLPLPHLLMLPLVYFDFLWRTGLAGSIIAGIAFVISCLYIYKFTYLFTQNNIASFFAFLVFGLNPNILYLQSTALTELPLIAFFLLSSYYFTKYLRSKDNILMLLLASFFGFCAALTRYDGWFLVIIESLLLVILFLPNRKNWTKMQGRVVMFSTLTFFAICLWLLWDYLILGDPLYFTNSIYSAKSQQLNWLNKGQLPGYHNILMSFWYYFVTSMSLSGILLFLTSLVGLILFLQNHLIRKRYFVFILLTIPFIFNVVTLYLGQSVIFIPSLTPASFEWKLFNVRYGILMLPFVAFMTSYLFYRSKSAGKLISVLLLLLQFTLFAIGYSQPLALQDGTTGLSASKTVDAQLWLKRNYTGGLLLLDDYARTISIIKSGVPMQQVINVGTKPYYTDSYKTPEKYATWIVMQKNDDIWTHLYVNQAAKGRLYKYFNKVYTSKEILIFKKIQTKTLSSVTYHN